MRKADEERGDARILGDGGSVGRANPRSARWGGGEKPVDRPPPNAEGVKEGGRGRRREKSPLQTLAQPPRASPSTLDPRAPALLVVGCKAVQTQFQSSIGSAGHWQGRDRRDGKTSASQAAGLSSAVNGEVGSSFASEVVISPQPSGEPIVKSRRGEGSRDRSHEAPRRSTFFRKGRDRATVEVHMMSLYLGSVA